jgi:hypothetical protein
LVYPYCALERHARNESGPNTCSYSGSASKDLGIRQLKIASTCEEALIFEFKLVYAGLKSNRRRKCAQTEIVTSQVGERGQEKVGLLVIWFCLFTETACRSLTARRPNAIT